MIDKSNLLAILYLVIIGENNFSLILRQHYILIHMTYTLTTIYYHYVLWVVFLMHTLHTGKTKHRLGMMRHAETEAKVRMCSS